MPITVITPPTAPPPSNRPLFPLKPPPPLAAQNLDLGAHELALYLLGGTALRDFVRPLGVTVFKAGVTGCREAARRAEDCRRKKYASILKRPNDPADVGRELALGDEWFISPLNEEWLDGTALPPGIRIRDGVIRLAMPSSITVVEVDKALHRILQPRAFNVWLDSPGGQRQLVGAGYDPKARLFTRYTLMTREPRLSLASELYLIRPKRELRTFIGAIDAMAGELRAAAKAKMGTGAGTG